MICKKIMRLYLFNLSLDNYIRDGYSCFMAKNGLQRILSPTGYENATACYRQWYARLLRFYPKPYRERFGEGMEQTFNDLCRERYRDGGRLFSFVLWAFADTFAEVIKENIKIKKETMMMPILRHFGTVIISVIAAIAIIVSTYLTKNLDSMWVILILLFIALPLWERWIKDKR